MTCVLIDIKSSTLISRKLTGDNSIEATPVPISNTEVKLSSADGTAWATVWESRSPPDPYIEGGVGLTADTTLFCGPVAQLVRAHA